MESKQSKQILKQEPISSNKQHAKQFSKPHVLEMAADKSQYTASTSFKQAQYYRGGHRRNKSSDLAFERMHTGGISSKDDNDHRHLDAPCTHFGEGELHVARSMKDISCGSESPSRRRKSHIHPAKSFIELSRSIESLSRVVHEAGPMSNPLPVSRTIARRRRSSLKPLDNAVLWTDAAPDDDDSSILMHPDLDLSKYHCLPGVGDTTAMESQQRVPSALDIDTKVILGPIGTQDHRRPDWVEDDEGSVSAHEGVASWAFKTINYEVAKGNLPFTSEGASRNTSRDNSDTRVNTGYEKGKPPHQEAWPLSTEIKTKYCQHLDAGKPIDITKVDPNSNKDLSGNTMAECLFRPRNLDPKSRIDHLSNHDQSLNYDPDDEEKHKLLNSTSHQLPIITLDSVETTKPASETKETSQQHSIGVDDD